MIPSPHLYHAALIGIMHRIDDADMILREKEHDFHHNQARDSLHTARYAVLDLITELENRHQIKRKS